MGVYGRRYDVGWLEQRLLPLGFGVVLCTPVSGSFRAAREELLAVSDNAAEYDRRDGFVAEQRVVRRFVQLSALPSHEVKVSHNHVSRAVQEVADWLQSTGGRYL